MIKLFLVRHGRPLLPREKIFYGSTDIPLCQKGREQAKALSPIWKLIKPRYVYSSPLSRSLDTARLSGLEPEIVDDLSEINMGSWEMAPFVTISSDHSQDFKARWLNIETFTPPEGESFHDVAERAQRAFRLMIKEKEGTVVVFGHIGVFRTMLWRELGLPLKSTFALSQDHCGMHVLGVRPDRTTLERANWAPLDRWGET